MNRTLARPLREHKVQTWIVAFAVILFAAILGAQASTRWMALLVIGLGVLVLLQKPVLGLFALIAVALLVPMEFRTGTDVSLNPATLLLPALLVFWLLTMVRQRNVHLQPSRTIVPLMLFLLAGLVSLLIGNAYWDAIVPRSSNFWIVQLAQWAIFAFSAGAFLLTGNMIKNEAWLRRLTFAFLLLAGTFAILDIVLSAQFLVGRFATIALIRTPFWILLASLAGGQLLFNPRLSFAWRAFMILSLVGVVMYAFLQQREATSNWVGVAAVAGVLIWLRWSRLRLLIVMFVVTLTILGVLFPSIYEFAGGDAEWQESGGSRLVLTERVIEVTMRNPITGLGPAAYRPYANMKPLQYGRAFWTHPLINSHNNYVDIFAHTGLVGLGLFLWFMGEVAWLAWRLSRRFQRGFVAGYTNGMLAAWAGIMVVMLLLDWFLPFVYNVGFPGFQASILVWLFLGGLVAIEQWTPLPSETPDPDPER